MFFVPFFFLPESDDEDDEYLPGYAEPILEPKDPYSARPLPIKIGTPAFLQEDDVGLGEYASDEGVCVCVCVCVCVWRWLRYM